MSILIKNIKELIQVEEHPKERVCGEEMAKLDTIKNSWLYISGGKISGFGTMGHMPEKIEAATTIDAAGKMVFPSWCDSHTHLVYPSSREIEYVDKIKGLTYEEIAKRGGGILNSAAKMQEISEDELLEGAKERIDEIIKYGTGAVEIKSGYGLTAESELKMLRVIVKLKEISPVEIKSTFLGAHAIPAKYKENRTKYIDLIVEEMLPQVAEEKLADYVDVFCDRGFFSVKETCKILEAAAKYGLKPKIHANELGYSGGIQAGVKYDALSVDHLEYTGKDEIEALKSSGTMPTILPGAAFFLNLKRAPARAMINAGLPVAMASDFNPGSSPSGNMQFIMSLACIEFKMMPEEAINAITINSAYAMGLSKTHGSIARGKIANVFITKEIPTYHFMPYYFGTNKIETVILKGEVI